MKPLLALALFSSLNTAWSAESRFYLGTYTKEQGSKGIYSCSLDTETGRLGSVQLAAETENPSYLAMTPDGKFLYAAREMNHQGWVSAFRVETDSRLTLLNQQDAGGDGTCHVSVDATGRDVLAANYNSGNLSCFQTKPDGSLGERTALIQFAGSGPNRDRQSKPHAHSVYPAPSNRFVYSCDLGTDHVGIFKFDAERGTLESNSPAAANAPAGGGPRHLAFHPGGKFVYVNNEMGLSVSVFGCDPASGVLTPVQVIPTLPETTPGAGTTTAEIACHPSGKWLYVSTRGDDTLARFAIGVDGRLT
ncbi:MAG: lactonase family protein, partial [Verrucomicrobiota bacterium]